MKIKTTNPDLWPYDPKQAKEATPNNVVKFEELTFGDRFMAYGYIWTKIRPNHARRHQRYGYGNNGASVCMFDDMEEVIFQELDSPRSNKKGEH